MRLLRLLKRRSEHAAMYPIPTRLKAESGQALVELALSVPIMALLVFGAVEMGNIIYSSIEVTDAAMAGVQYGTRNSTAAADTTGIENAARADAPNLTLTFSNPPSVSCICSDGSASTCLSTDCSGSNIETILTVQTQATVDPLLHFPGLSRSIVLQGKAVQKVLQ